jgi:protein-tyrosine-phosphatase
MAERGIDISEEYPKPWTDETVRAADVVIHRQSVRGFGPRKHVEP